MTSFGERSGSPSLVARVRNAILSGDLMPKQRLVEADLTEMFTAPRSAVREVLVQLESEGLVEREHNRGARVRSISIDEAIEITEARAVLEGLCAAKAATRITSAEQGDLRAIGERMRDAVEGGDIMAYSSIAQDIHTRVRELAHQDTVATLLERLRYQSIRFHFSVALLPGRPTVGLREHLEVIEAIAAGTPDDAEQVMRRHLMTVVDRLRDLATRPEGAPRHLHADAADV